MTGWFVIKLYDGTPGGADRVWVMGMIKNCMIYRPDRLKFGPYYYMI